SLNLARDPRDCSGTPVKKLAQEHGMGAILEVRIWIVRAWRIPGIPVMYRPHAPALLDARCGFAYARAGMTCCDCHYSKRLAVVLACPSTRSCLVRSTAR